uniref:Uncharacterized protein n=1 Tax=Anopheles culicifacies TaxID=139723 RepID=A0A182MD21_9DIPT
MNVRSHNEQILLHPVRTVVLPEQPVVLDRWGRHINGTKLGPKEEGDDVVITCRVSGGKFTHTHTHTHTHPQLRSSKLTSHRKSALALQTHQLGCRRFVISCQTPR